MYAEIIGSNIILSENFKQLIQKKNKRVYFTVYSEDGYRSLMQNNYLFGVVYQAFKEAGNFSTVYEAHEFFGNKYLGVVDYVEIEEESTFDTIFFNRYSEAVRMCKKGTTPKNHRLENGIEIYYVKSTTQLEIRAMNKYIKEIENFGLTHGIYFEKFDKSKDYN